MQSRKSEIYLKLDDLLPHVKERVDSSSERLIGIGGMIRGSAGRLSSDPKTIEPSKLRTLFNNHQAYILFNEELYYLSPGSELVRLNLFNPTKWNMDTIVSMFPKELDAIDCLVPEDITNIFDLTGHFIVDKTFLLIPHLAEGIRTIPRDIELNIKQASRRFLTSRNIDFSVKIIHSSEQPDYAYQPEEITQAVKIKLIMNLTPYTGLTFKQWLDLSKGREDLDSQIQLLQQFIKKAIFNEKLAQYFPDIMRDHDILKSSFFYNTLETLKKNFTEYNEQLKQRVELCIARITKYTAIQVNGTFYGFHWTNMLQGIQEANIPTYQKWSRIQTTLALIEDSKDEMQVLFDKVQVIVNRMDAFKKCWSDFNRINSGIEEKYLFNIYGSTNLFRNFPDISKIDNYEQAIKVDFDHIQKNLECFESGFRIFQKVIEKNHSIKELTEEKIEPKHVRKKPEKVAEKIPQSDADSTSHHFFKPEPIYQDEPSVTAECKARGVAQIRKQEQRQEQRNNRNTGIFSEPTKADISPDRIVYFLENGKVKASPIFHLGKTKHIYLSCDLPVHLQQEAKMKEFLVVAQSCRLLKQSSLGSNGIKLYGLNFMVIKSCKRVDGDRLLCLAYPVMNSKDYVYRFEEIITHDEYVKLLNNPALVEAKRLGKNTDSVMMSYSEEDFQEVQKNARSDFGY